MSTARRQLRDAVLSAVRALSANITVDSPGEWDVAPSTMPAVRIRASADTKVGITKAPPNFTTTVAVDVQLYLVVAPQQDAQQQAEDLGDLLENGILSNGDLIALVQRFRTVTTQVHIITAGELPIAKIDTTLELETYEEFTDPGPFFLFKELDLYVDFKGGPVDPTGVYLNPPFPNDVAPPPRSPVDGGPDGRVEGFIRIDMTTGLPPAAGGDYPARCKVQGSQVIFPDGTTLDQKRGWSWGRWGTTIAADADLAVAQGAAATPPFKPIIRIPLRWWGLYGSLDSGSGADSRDMTQPATAFIDSGHLATVDAQIQLCTDRGLPFILFVDSNCGQNGTQSEDDRTYCQAGDPDVDWPDGRNFLTDPTMFALFRQVWRFVALRYAKNPNWAVCELFPEPSFPVFTIDQIKQLYRTLAADVRQCAPGIPFLVGPWQYKLTSIKDAWDPTQVDFIYTGNGFARENQSNPVAKFQSDLQFMLNLRSKQGVPIFMQQIGVNSSSGGDDATHDWLRGVLNAMTTGDSLGPVGATYWELRDPTANSDPGGYGGIWTNRTTGLDVVKADYMAVIAGWIAGQLM